MTTKIDWCDEVWNPVWGCLNTCEYCYARKINQRFKRINPEFKPQWIESNFNKKFPKKPSRIFVNSMSDISYWQENWMNNVIKRVFENQQHIFIFLTKDPFYYAYKDFPDNCYVGMTIPDNEKLKYHDTMFPFFVVKEKNTKIKTFISIEPIQEKIHKSLILKDYIDWVIVGAETGNRKNKIIPEPEWIEEFTKLNIPVFMKDNLKPYYDEELLKEFPKC